jgi:hypothetical protein
MRIKEEGEAIFTISFLGWMRASLDSEEMPVRLEIVAISCCRRVNFALVRNLLAISSYFPLSLNRSFRLFRIAPFSLFKLILNIKDFK